jgi:hypothetical protein
VRRRTRIVSACLIVAVMLAGVAVAIAFDGVAADVVATMLISIPVVAAVSLVFLEVGLSEDRERAGEQAERERDEQARDHARRTPRSTRSPRRR